MRNRLGCPSAYGMLNFRALLADCPHHRRNGSFLGGYPALTGTNQQSPLSLSGIILGGGLYMYQAVRMLPIVVLVGVTFAVLGGGRNRQQIMRYGYNLMALVIISAVVFIPLFVFFARRSGFVLVAHQWAVARRFGHSRDK
jgi:hypothetical protein